MECLLLTDCYFGQSSEKSKRERHESYDMQDVETYDKHWVLAIPYNEMNKISLTNERS